VTLISNIPKFRGFNFNWIYFIFQVFEENNWIWASLPRKTQKLSPRKAQFGPKPISPSTPRAEPTSREPRPRSREPSRHVSIAAAPQAVGPSARQSQRATRPVGSACSPAYARVARTASPPREFSSRARHPDFISLPRGSRVPESIQPDRATCPTSSALCSTFSPAREWPADTCPTLQNVMNFLHN